MALRIRIASLLIALACGALLAACSDGGEPAVGPPAELTLVNTNVLTAPANTELSGVQIKVVDANDRPVSNQSVTFAVTAGAGSITATTGVSDSLGVVAVPAWKMGKSDVAQTMRATLNALTLDISASVQTSYDIELRFWGSQEISQADRQLFVNAANRIAGIIMGDIDNVSTGNQEFDPAFCGVTGEDPIPPQTTIDDVIIYASIDSIDAGGSGNSNIVAQAGPCAGRPTTARGYHTAIGVMQFDEHDFPQLAGSQGGLQDVVTHEMMHVLGFGVYWSDDVAQDGSPIGRMIIEGEGSTNPRYIGASGKAGCVAVGGTITCASSVPLENNFGPGSNDSHWRDGVFGSELMTSLLSSVNPISQMTIGQFEDLGFIVNSADFDTYTIPTPVALRTLSTAGPPKRWERVLQPIIVIEKNGRLRRIRASP